MLGYGILQIQPTEPAIGKVQLYLFAKPSLRSNPEAVANDEHPDHQLRIH
jgi:hypothetical protein